MTQAGGHGIAVRCDHTVPSDVDALVQRIADEQDGRLDVLVDNAWGGDQWIEGTPFWEHDLDNGLEMHLITLHKALPLMVRRRRGLIVEITDGDDMFNEGYRGSMFFDMIKVGLARPGKMRDVALSPHGITSVSLTPGYLRSEEMLEHFGVPEENWRDAIVRDRWFAVSESPRYIGRAVVALAPDPDVARRGGQALSPGLLAGTMALPMWTVRSRRPAGFSPTPTLATRKTPTWQRIAGPALL